MRIEKINSCDKEHGIVKNDAHIVPFDENEFPDTQTIKQSTTKTTSGQAAEQEQIQIDSLKSQVLESIEFDTVPLAENSKSSLLKLIDNLSGEKSLLYPVKVDIMEDGSLNIISNKGNIITIKNLIELLDFDNYQLALEKEIINVRKDSGNYSDTSLINLKIFTDKADGSLRSIINKIYGGYLRMGDFNDDAATGKTGVFFVDDRPVSVNLKLIQPDGEHSRNFINNVREIISPVFADRNSMYVKILEGTDEQILLNGKAMGKYHNLLDRLFNRNLMTEYPNAAAYPSNEITQYEILLLDNSTQSLAIDIAGAGILFIDEKQLKKIINYLPQTAALYYSGLTDKWYHKLFRKYANWKILIALTIVILVLLTIL